MVKQLALLTFDHEAKGSNLSREELHFRLYGS